MTHYPLLSLTPPPAAVLSVRDILLSVHLGVPDDERITPQAVRVHVDILFAALPACASSDDLADTLCYDTLTKAFTAAIDGKAFKLIETLCGTLSNVARPLLPSSCALTLQALKVNPPVDTIHGGAAFTVHTHS